MKAYAGIGSRKTPSDVLDLMVRIGERFAMVGWTLRSGGAPGADSAFHRGFMNTHYESRRHPDAAAEIYLPWKGFNGNTSPLYSPSPEAFALAAQFHPNWAACSHAARALHARNGHQVLGLNLNSPATLIVCWTVGGLGTGGTGQALRIARAHGVKIHDLAIACVREEYERRLA